MAQSDVIVIGAGYNGLTAAAYLARAGRSVTVLEQGEQLGGLATFDEIAPGFRAPALFSTVDRLHPSVVAELALERHGFRIQEGGGTLLMQPGGEAMYAPPGGLPEEASPEDRASLAEFERFLGRVAKALEPVLGDALPPVEPSGIGDLIDLLGLGWRLRRLGRKEMPAAMRLLPMALRDVTEEHVRDERLRAAVAWIGLVGSGVGPWAPGTALQLLFQRPPWFPGLFPGARFAAGADLGEALAAAAQAAGAKIRPGARVSRILVDDERVAGVVLDSGEELAAGTVISAVDPKTTMLELLEPGWLQPDVAEGLRNVRARGTVSAVRLALGEAPVLPGGKRAVGRIQIGPTLRYLERAADGVKYRRLPEELVIDATLPSAVATGLAPRGRHVLHAWVQYTPYELENPSWDEGRGLLADATVATLDAHFPGLARSVEAVDVITPPDIRTRFGLTGGHPFHAEPALDQALYMRPVPGMHEGRTPIAGLWLGGPGIHPGGGVTGLPGKLCAKAVLRGAKA